MNPVPALTLWLLSSKPTAPKAGDIEWKETKLAAEPAGEPVDLIQTVNLDRDVGAGTWQKASTALIGSPDSRLDRRGPPD